MTVRYFDRDGTPMSLIEWATKFEDPATHRVEWDDVDGVTISTVWLGLDHQWGHGPPLIFETMIFGGMLDEFQARYSTIEQARDGHATAVRSVREHLTHADYEEEL